VEPPVEVLVVAGNEAGHVFVDPAEIERVVLNLVINARDAMPGTGGRIEVRTELVTTDDSLRPQFVSLSVSDTGHGMDPETAEHCFEPFFTTKGRAHGTGLGLAAVHAVVTQAGGYVTLESAPGAGTTFTVWLPSVGDEMVARSEATATTEGPGGEELVLVVEDEDDLRRLAVGELARRGYAVLSVSNGSDALVVADGLEATLDLLVTDVVMPGMSGVALATELVARFPSLPVLFVSGHANDDPRTGNLLGDDADFLAKPYTPQQLARRVREALDRAPRRVAPDGELGLTPAQGSNR
ncbi:MAG TPA: ATP-binding protein, partial [Acidimicrobiales bacterium]|nr:ATP-binding protein [Acidimicrobiales bacterium]